MSEKQLIDGQDAIKNLEIYQTQLKAMRESTRSGARSTKRPAKVNKRKIKSKISSYEQQKDVREATDRGWRSK